MTKTKTPTEEMIAQLCAAEEVLAALDQLAGSDNELTVAARTAYERMESAIRRRVANWNGDLEADEQTVFRCSEASKNYHTDADGPCDVWSTDRVCGLHIQLAEEAV